VSKETDIVYELKDSTGRRIEIYRDFNYFLEKTKEPPFTKMGVIRNFIVDEKRLLIKWEKFISSYIYKKKLVSTFNLISSYINSIEKDMPPPVTSEDGRNTINLLECIEKSLEQRKMVKL
jgi:hypothetical protein